MQSCRNLPTATCLQEGTWKNNQQSKEVYKERRRHKTLALGDPPSEGSGRKSYDEDPEKLADDSRAAEPLGQTVMVT